MITNDQHALNDLGKAGADKVFIHRVKTLLDEGKVEWHYGDGGGFFLAPAGQTRPVLVATYDYGADFEVAADFWDF